MERTFTIDRMGLNARNAFKACAAALVSAVACGAAAKGASFYAPEKIYAAPGVPCAVNYTRLFDSYTPQRYLLEAISEKGTAYSECWLYTAKESEAGTSFPLVLNAWDDDAGLVASMTTTVCVAKTPSEAAKSRRIAFALLAAARETGCFVDAATVLGTRYTIRQGRREMITRSHGVTESVLVVLSCLVLTGLTGFTRLCSPHKSCESCKSCLKNSALPSLKNYRVLRKVCLEVGIEVASLLQEHLGKGYTVCGLLGTKTWYDSLTSA